ncbi:MAG: histidinol dehydrogenase [Prevotella sp.]|nr:histidinol dehydrogenase [Prevotella sp.]
MLNVYIHPKKSSWAELLSRPEKDPSKLNTQVSQILDEVKRRGDEALKDFSKEFDKVDIKDLKVSQEEIDKAQDLISKDLFQAIKEAHKNIYTFHKGQVFSGKHCQVTPGVECWQKSVPIEKVGLYIPGGTAPLFSTVLMLATPAKIAGCGEIVLCTPPSKDGSVNPAILASAKVAGVSQIFKVGGAGAIAAMAYGTKTIPKVYKVFGPGNQYVTLAKQLVSLKDVAIDFPAGPSEVMVLADSSSNIEFVASDLLSQAEHGVDSQVILLTEDEGIVPKIISTVKKQLDELPRKEIASKSLENSRIIVLSSTRKMMEFANLYAPEHLIIETKDYKELALQVVNAGSVFLGGLTPESAGDYASGTNHTLPTNGYAKAYAGVSLDTFMRKITFQHISKEGISSIGKIVETMAEAESLNAHKNAMRLRRLSLEDNLNV